MNFFQTIIRYARLITPANIAAVMAIIKAIEELLDVLSDPTNEKDGKTPKLK